MTSTHQFAFEKVIEAEQRWSQLSLDVFHVCGGCHLTNMRKEMVEFGHANERQQKPVYESSADSPLKNTALNWVIPYWLDGHGTIHTASIRMSQMN
jgi:hypothetical protein